MSNLAGQRIAQAKETQDATLDLSELKLSRIPTGLRDLVNLSHLNLAFNKLTMVPAWISEFTGLARLDLRDNLLAAVPESLAELISLTYLDLGFNQLTVVPEWIGRLANLTHLDLGFNQLTVVPEWIGDLTNLTHLDLGRSGLTVVPEWIGRLANLTHLELGFNQLTVVPEWIGDLTNLTHLDLGRNGLTVVPEWIGCLTNLTHLNLGFNNLKVVPDWIGDLTNLTHLNLGASGLTVVPEWIGNLTNLTHLDLGFNQLTVVPEWIGNLTNLTHLDLRGNELTAVPQSLADLTAFTLLDLGFNNLKVVPDWIGDLTNLTHLNLSNCGLTVVPEWIGNLTELRDLDLSNNELAAVPDWLANLTSLTALSLGSNELTAMPEWIGNLTNLTRLDLSNSGLTVVPEWIGNLTELRDLDLSNNELAAVPDWLANLTSLTALSLGSNELTAMPEWIGNLTNLTRLDLSNSGLTVVPEWIGNLTNLRDLNLHNNMLAVVPEWIGNLTNLRDLDLSNNELAAVPDWLANLTSLTALSLGSNELTAMPEWIGNLTNLTRLDLSNSDMTAVPDWIGNLTNLLYLNLRGNQLTEVPDSLAKLSSLRWLYLDGNQLSGLPETLGDLTGLIRLDLQNNTLTAVPETLGKLARLDRLGLRDNDLTAVPETLGGLTGLTYLDLGGNDLTAVPETLGGLTGLTYLDLGGNDLTAVPETLGGLTGLTYLDLGGNDLTAVPETLGGLTRLDQLHLRGNALSPEATAAAEHGTQAILAFLRELQTDGVTVRQAKLVLVGEGAVGKSSLLAAMLGEPFNESRQTTHGVEVKPLKIETADGTEIELNAWDFGGQKTYRPSHQFFFTAPAIYVIAWNPRLGAAAGCVEEWVNLVRHRVGDDVRIHIVATHSDPHGQLGDLDEDRLVRDHGACIAGFHRVNSKTGRGIVELKTALTETVVSLPHLERRLPARWQHFLTELNSSGTSHLDYRDYVTRAKHHGLEAISANSLARVATELGHWCFYPEIPGLSDIVVLRGDWLSHAVSLVLNDPKTKNQLGLVTHEHLSQLWNNRDRPPESRYDLRLHPALRLLMHEYQIAYDIHDASSAPSSLISQLVPTSKPDLKDWEQYGPDLPQQIYIIKFLDAKRRATIPEGLMNQLITWFHRFSLGRQDFSRSLHWAQGLVLDDRYNGRALIRVDDDTLTVTVKAASPSYLCNMISNDICNYISDWKGLKATRLVPCGDRCIDPGQPWSDTAPFDIEPLQRLKVEGRDEAACGACHRLVPIGTLLGDGIAPLLAANSSDADAFAAIDSRLDAIASQIADEGLRTRSHVSAESNSIEARLRTQIEEQTQLYLHLFADDAVEGPRLFTIESNDMGARIGKLTKRRIRVVLWCEHSRLPVHMLTQDPHRGVYDIDIAQEWLVRARPWLGIATQVLRLGADFVPAILKLNLDEAQWKSLEDRLSLAQTTVKELATVGSSLSDNEPSIAATSSGAFTEPTRGQLQALHVILNEQDPDFAGLQRVRDRDRFLWVHPRFARHYE